MRLLQEYILEKFKISKDTKGELLKEGDPIVKVCFFVDTSTPDLQIGGATCKHVIFEKIKNNRIYFNPDSEVKYYDYEDTIFINDKGFYEVKGHEYSKLYSLAVYLDKDTAIDCIEKLIPFYPDNPSEKEIDCNKIKSILENYFDTFTKLPDTFSLSFALRRQSKNWLQKLKKDLEAL